MMGRLNGNRGQLFYSFCLEEMVPVDHLVREIAGVLDLSWVHGELGPYYSSLGRPSIDPVLMIRMLIIGYVFAIRSASRAVKEYLATLDDAAYGAATDGTPKFVSPSDPAAQWTGAMRGPAFLAFANNYLIDVKFGVIVDVEASRAIRQAEVGAAKTMIERTQQRFGIMPERLAADSAYGSATALHWIVNEKNIVPHIPVIDKSEREDGTLSRSDFTFDKDRNVYVCPEGKLLRTTGRIQDGDIIFYRATTMDCGPCRLKAKCCPKSPQRRIPRSIYEEARDVARSLAGTEAFERSRHDRKRVEMLFAHLKRILKLGRLRLRGPHGAQDEFTHGATAQNLRRLAKLVARPPPLAAACVA